VVECQLPKLDVAGSTPVSRSNFSIAFDISGIVAAPEPGTMALVGMSLGSIWYAAWGKEIVQRPSTLCP
jgi:hypothetical protein